LLIAGQALARGLALVNHNAREFGRVEGLRVESCRWSVDEPTLRLLRVDEIEDVVLHTPPARRGDLGIGGDDLEAK
jgi:hypothetical protein